MKWAYLFLLLVITGCSMRINDTDIGGKEVGPAKFDFKGDKEKARDLSGIGRKLLGELKQSMTFNNLLQHQAQVKLKDGTIIRAHSIKGQDGMADIDKIFIEAPQGGEEKKAMLMDICTGFIVQMKRTSNLDDELFWRVYGLEPVDGSEDSEPTPGVSSTTPWIVGDGQGINTWRYFPETPGDNFFDDPTGVSFWHGFEADGFARRGGEEYARIYGGSPDTYQMSLMELDLDYTSNYPAVGPQVGDVLPGADPGDHIAVGHWLSSPDSDSFINIQTISPWSDYNANIALIHAAILTNEFDPANPSHEIGNGSRFTMMGTENNFIASLTPVINLGDKTYDFPQDPWENDRNSLQQEYSSVALLPKGSKITSRSYYDYAGDPVYGPWTNLTYENEPDPETGEFDFSIYQSAFKNVLDSGVTMPYSIGSNTGDPPDYPVSTMQTNQYPNLWLPPTLYYIDQYITNEWVIDQRESVGKPDIKALSGYYKVRVIALDGQAKTTGQEYDLEITLFGSHFLAKTTLKGIVGEKNDKLKILVNTPIEFEEGDLGAIFSQLLVIER